MKFLEKSRVTCYAISIFGEWFTSFSRVLPTSRVGYHAGKRIESVVYYFYKMTLSKTENVSVSYKFTSTINHRFLTNQNARTMWCECKYHIIHSPQGFSGIIYNTGWGILPDCLTCSLQVMKKWVMMPPYYLSYFIKDYRHWKIVVDLLNSCTREIARHKRRVRIAQGDSRGVRRQLLGYS